MSTGGRELSLALDLKIQPIWDYNNPAKGTEGVLF